jgi:2-keto-3-deoxy-galactonokinase
MITSVIYILDSFAVPGPVEDLFLIPGSHSIFVNWKNPIINKFCVTEYVVQWAKLPNNFIKGNIVSKEEDSYVIEGLDAGVEYEVSVRAVNALGKGKDAVTCNTKTENDGMYQT